MKRKSVMVFGVLFLIMFLFSACNSQGTSNSSLNLEKETIREETKAKTGIEIQVYAGPGEDFYKEALIDSSEVLSITKIEGKWFEISYKEGGRGYILRDTIKEDINSSDAYSMVKQIDQNVTLQKQLFLFHIPYKLTGDIEILSVPAKRAMNQIINAGQEIILINIEPQQKESAVDKLLVDDYWQIEVTTSRGKERVYVLESDLFDTDNPLRNFDDVKNNNAEITYNGNTYYSASGAVISGFSNNWKSNEEINLQTDLEFSFIDGIIGMASTDMTDISEAADSTEQKLYLSQVEKGKKNYHSTLSPVEASDTVDSFNVAMFLADEFLNFLGGAITPIETYNVQFQVYGSEGKMVIRSGVPIECMKNGRFTGKEFDFSTFIDDGSIIGGAVQNASYVDSMLRKAYPELTGSKNYSLKVKYANSEDCASNPYGYYLLIDKDLNCYTQLILHPNTSFIIYYDGKPVKDISIDLCRSLYQLDEATSSKIIKLLENNGIKFINDKVNETNLYKEYVAETVIPQIGASNMETFTATMYNDDYDGDWGNRNGLFAMDIRDINADGKEELLLYICKPYSGHNDMYGDYYINNGMGLEIYSVDANGDVYKTDEEYIGSYSGHGVNIFGGGYLSIDGQVYLLVEDLSYGVMANGLGYSLDLYQFDKNCHINLAHTISNCLHQPKKGRRPPVRGIQTAKGGNNNRRLKGIHAPTGG